MAINQVTFEGYLQQSFFREVTVKGSAMTVCSLSFKILNPGGRDTGASFVDCDFWEATDSFIETLKNGRGNKFLVSGRLKQDSWEDKKTGNKRSKVKVVAASVAKVEEDSQERQSQGSNEELPF